MRTVNIEGVSIKYADKIGFAFMPCLIISESNKMANLVIELDFNGIMYTCYADAYKGKAVVDYREYVQAYFDSVKFSQIDYSGEAQESKLGIYTTVSITVMNDDDKKIAEFEFDTYYVWGAMRPSETWNGWKKLTWFKHFPFSFNVYADATTKVAIGFNGAPQKNLELSNGIYDIPSSQLPKDADYSVIYRYEGEVKLSTFDKFFDNTFQFKIDEQTTILRIEYNDTESGVYLRWIDRQGFYRYWLFAQGDEERAISSETSFIRNNLAEYDDTFGYVGANGRRQGYEREDTIYLCAPLVDRETFDFLQDIASSPVVDMYLDNDNWQSVSIKAGSYTKTTAELQDFNCQLVLNNIYIQRL